MTVPPAPRSGAVPVAPAREPLAQRGTPRADRDAFERALARQPGATGPASHRPFDPPGRNAPGDVGPPPGCTDPFDRSDEPGNENARHERDGARQGAATPDPERAREEAGHVATADTLHGDREGRDDDRRRWLDGVLEALDAASDSAPPLGRPRDSLDVDAAVPGLGPVRLQLSWAEGGLRVTLRCTVGQGVPNIAGNPHTESLRRALAARVPPVALQLAGADVQLAGAQPAPLSSMRI